jgi:CRISPR/Cas system-associated exonuclease Cas4 (RecB family)
MIMHTTEPILDIEGKEMKIENGKPATVGRFIADILLKTKTEFDVMKAYDLGMRFYRDAEIEIDKPDAEKLIRVIEEVAGPWVIAKGQVIEKIREALGGAKTQ